MEALSPSVVLAAYAEQLFDGRRVVMFGDSTSIVAEELVERGARTVHVYDPESSRAALAAGQNKTKQISIAPLDDADLAVRDGAFDVAFIEDLSSFEHPEPLLRRVRRALSSRGAAIVAAPNPEARVTLLPHTSGSRASSPLGYYELYDAVSAEFAEVRMLGQTPFVGYAVVDFAPEGEPDVSIDSGLVPGGAEEPEWFVALASRERVDCDPVGIVQLPAAKVTNAGVSGALSEDLRTARSSEARLLDRVAELEVEAAELREQAEDTTSIDHRARLEAELLQREASIADLEAQLVAAEARDARSREELGGLRRNAETADVARAELARLTPAQGRLESELVALKQHSANLHAELGALKQHSAKLDSERAALKEHSANLEAELAARKKELAELAPQLAELAKKNGELAGRSVELEKAKVGAEARVAEQAREVAAQRQKLTGVETELAQLRAEDETPRELAALEATLKERGEHIRSLSEQLREAERVGRELLRELGRGPGLGGSATGTELMAAENARLTANLEALSWTVEELEGRLSAASSAPR